MALRRAALALIALTVLAAPALTGCGGGGKPAESATQLLARAKTTLDKASSAHFVLTSKGAPTTGTALVGGQGGEIEVVINMGHSGPESLVAAPSWAKTRRL